MKKYKLVFISNYFNHHQKPFSEQVFLQTKESFIFIETEHMSVERKQLGYNMSHLPHYVIPCDVFFKCKDYFQEIINNADVVIIGSAPDSYIIPRLKANKLTIKYSERFYKKGLSLKRMPLAFVSSWLHHGRFQKYPLYLLCASAYTAGDVAIFRNYLGRTYKWGYFPEAKKYKIDELMKKKKAYKLNKDKSFISILWAGRLIDWKHPEVAIDLAAYLKQKGYFFKLDIIGSGEMQDQLNSLIKEKNVSDCVQMLGAMSPDRVREHMENADIFLFTSDYNEGWGAVLNESMNSGCAVVASHAIGSVPFLIQDGKNGLIYENGNSDQFKVMVERLIKDEDYRIQMGIEAYHTIVNMWCAEVAVKRLMKLINCLLNNQIDKELFQDDGPCSKAKIIHQKNMFKTISKKIREDTQN